MGFEWPIRFTLGLENLEGAVMIAPFGCWAPFVTLHKIGADTLSSCCYFTNFWPRPLHVVLWFHRQNGRPTVAIQVTLSDSRSLCLNYSLQTPAFECGLWDLALCSVGRTSRLDALSKVSTYLAVELETDVVDFR